MALTYFIILLASTIASLVVARSYKTHGEDYRLGLKILLYLSAAYSASYIMAGFSKNLTLAMIFFCIFRSITIWINFIFLLFSLHYGKFENVPKRLKDIIFVFVVIDNLIFLSNIFTGKIFTIYRYELGLYFINRMENTAAGAIIDAFAAVLIVGFLLVCIYKLKRDPRLYKTQYIVVLVSVIVVETINALFIAMDRGLEITPVKYTGVTIILVYMTERFVSSYLKMGILTQSYANSDTAIFLFDQYDRCVDFNSVAKDIFPEIEMTYSHGEFVNKFIKDDPRNLNGQKSIINIDGEPNIYRFEFDRLFDEEDRYIGSYYFYYNISEDERINAERLKRVSSDKLTGLLNESAFMEVASSLLVSNPKIDYRVVATNISEFKLVNNVLGRRVGDEVLKILGLVFSEFSSENTCVARMNADRFALLIPKDIDIEALNQKTNEKLKEVNRSLTISCYFGVYEIEDRTEGADQMYENAKIALSSLKLGGANHIAYYETELKQKIISDNKLLADLDKGIENKEFVLYFQPQIDSHTDTVIGAEALIRWEHPERGFLTPYHFIGLFESYGLLYELDKYVWRSAAETVKRLHALGFPVAISVNISANDIFVGDLHKHFVDLVKEYDLNPKYLRLEITETAIMLDMAKLKKLVNDLQKSGFTVEMDDFGSGYSSLNTLKDIPVEVIKTDMLFLEKTENEERGLSIFKSIISLAKTLRAPLIAEGVETKEQVELLKELGCHNIQGYYYAKPMPYDDFTEYLKAHSISELKE